MPCLSPSCEHWVWFPRGSPFLRVPCFGAGVRTCSQQWSPISPPWESRQDPARGAEHRALRRYASFLMLPVGLTPVLCSLSHLRGCLSSAPDEGCLFPRPPLLSAVEGWSGWDPEKSISWSKGKINSFLTDRSDLSFTTPAGMKWHNLPWILVSALLTLWLENGPWCQAFFFLFLPPFNALCYYYSIHNRHERQLILFLLAAASYIMVNSF